MGHGLGKSREVATAIQKGIEDGKKDMINVPLVNGTIPHAQEMKYAVLTLIRPASPGTGVIAGGAMRACSRARASPTSCQVFGSSNPHNVVKATFNALKELRSAQDVAQLRGIPVTKVFNG